jgi:MerR family transcriptional regulator, light-induced transcriptional regulator
MTPGSFLYRPVSLDHEYLAGKLVEKYAGAHARIWMTFSAERRGEIRDEFIALTGSLQESLATASPTFLIDYVCREEARSAHRHLPKGFVLSCLGILADVLPRELPADYREQAGEWIRQTARALKSSPECSDSIPLSPAVQELLGALLAADPDRATAIIDTALTRGTPVRDIYLTLLQPLLRETGRRWQDGSASVANEHYVSAFVRRRMDQMHDRIALEGRRAHHGRTIVAACVGEELHDIGMRMVADFFELDGWNVYFIGANTPVRAIIDAVRDRKADAVALSITMPSRLPALQYLIRSLRADAATAPVKIIVGGYPFGIVPDLWKQVGADAGASSADVAVAETNRLTARMG